MKFRIHFLVGDDDTEDSIEIEGESIEELKKLAGHEVAKRNGRDPWSVELRAG